MKMTTVTGAPIETAVANSFKFMPKLPSPVISTVLQPEPTDAPMAAPKPKPIVPSPPLDTILRGARKSQYWAAHIWCCPTSVAMTVSGVVSALIMSIARLGVSLSVLI